MSGALTKRGRRTAPAFSGGTETLDFVADFAGTGDAPGVAGGALVDWDATDSQRSKTSAISRVKVFMTE
jgi:hypothetical protein